MGSVVDKGEYTYNAVHDITLALVSKGIDMSDKVLSDYGRLIRDLLGNGSKETQICIYEDLGFINDPIELESINFEEPVIKTFTETNYLVQNSHIGDNIIFF